MKRREFISCLAATPLALSGAWGAAAAPESLVFRRSPKRQVGLKVTAAEKELFDFLSGEARETYSYGAPIMARLSGAQPQWINLVADFRSFSDAKRRLFEFGVTPISTPELPTSAIKFRYRELIFNVVDSEIDSFCQSAYFGAKERKLSFAHSFLVWNPRTRELHDPFDAAADGNLAAFRLIGPPASLADAFDWSLAGRFEAHFLGLPLSEAFLEFESATLSDETPAPLAQFVAERVVNYFPEIVDHLGLDLARRYAHSPLVSRAMRESVGVDFPTVFDEFAKARSPQPRFKNSGVEFIAALHQSMGLSDELALLQGEVGRFMVRNNFTFRRPEWLIAPTALVNFNTPPAALA